MSRFESDLDVHLDRARSDVVLARSAVAESRRDLSVSRTSVEASAHAQVRLMAAERRLALIEWERRLDLETHRILWAATSPDDRLTRLTHRDIHGAVCEECLVAGSLILRGQKPPVSWAPTCGEPLDAYQSAEPA